MISKDGYDRIEYLREIINEGEDAAIVLKVAHKYLNKVSEDTLDILAKETDKDKLASAISDYKAVVRFCEMLNTSIDKGMRKEKSLVQELKKH